MAHTFNTKLVNVTVFFLKTLKAPVTTTTLAEKLESHPFFPSLYSVSDTLTKFNIENAAIAPSADELSELQVPFIAYCNTPSSGHDFVTVTEISADKVSYIHSGRKPVTVSREEFNKRYQNTVLVAEVNDRSGEKDYLVKLKIEKRKKIKTQFLYGSIAIIFVSLFISFISNSPNALTDTAMLISGAAGIGIAVLLLIYEIDKTNSFVKNICSSGKQTNCDAVLRSKASKLWGIAWSEWGLFYFSANFLFLVLAPIVYEQKILLVSCLNVLAATYIPFSIYYQYKIVKQWCRLCLVTQAILLVQALIAISHFFMQPVAFQAIQGIINTQFITTVAAMVLCAATSMVVWMLLKPVFLKAQKQPVYENAYKRLLYHPDYFATLLQQQPTAPDGWQDLGITIGNPHAPNTIIKVCNPYCGPCAKAHPVLEEIIHTRNDYKLKILFTASNKENDRGALPVRHFLTINENDGEIISAALDDWYMAKRKNYKEFAEKYPVNGELTNQNSRIDAMRKWCEDAGITHTPTIFINAQRLPETYSVQELKSIL